MVNDYKAARLKHGDQKSPEESTFGFGLARFALALGLAIGIGCLGSSAFLRNYGVASFELRPVLMLLFLPVEWGGALLILALLGDLKCAMEKRRSRVPAVPF